MRTIKFVIIFALMFSICYSADILLKQVIPSQGAITFHNRSGKSCVEVKIVTRQFAIKKTNNIDSLYIARCCTKCQVPCSVVDSFSILFNGRKVFVPLLVYCELSDLGRGDLSLENGKYHLKLQGGDASGSYCSEIIFDSTVVLQSIEFRSIFFTDTFASTRYKYIAF